MCVSVVYAPLRTHYSEVIVPCTVGQKEHLETIPTKVSWNE